MESRGLGFMLGLVFRIKGGRNRDGPETLQGRFVGSRSR